MIQLFIEKGENLKNRSFDRIFPLVTLRGFLIKVMNYIENIFKVNI